MNFDSSLLFNIKSLSDFEILALETFRFQAANNKVYNKYISLLKKPAESVNSLSDIPFLPIGFFKTNEIKTGNGVADVVFSSSGTTGEIKSKHYVQNKRLYTDVLLRGFELNFGKIEDYCILALLPSYLERNDSSIVYMANEWIKRSGCSDSGFFLNNYNDLSEILKKYNNKSKKIILLGVSFALLDLAEQFPSPLSENIIIMETGGMKGKRKEITRTELHQILCEKFGKIRIHSEYGMTELLSQAYSNGNGIFSSPPWMKILIRDPYDPFATVENGKSGGINIIDLANRYSCSFIETQDLGKINNDGTFEVLGRMEDSPVRGCNLMVG